MEDLKNVDDSEKVPWQGDYREPVIDDFMPNVTHYKKQRLIIRRFHGSLGITALSCLLIISTSIFRWLRGSSNELSASFTTIIENAEIWRLWSSLLIHSDFGHIASNLWLFGIFGYLLHSFWGPRIFPILSFGVLGGITSLLTVIWYGNSTYIIGASGMIYGMIGLWLVTYCYFETRYPMRTRIFRALGFVLIMLFPSTIAKNISYSAHSIGFLVGGSLGVLLCLFYGKRINAEEWT